MNYTQEQFKTATLITYDQYLDMVLTFEGQTRLDEKGNYKMYWSDKEGKLYVTNNSIL